MPRDGKLMTYSVLFMCILCGVKLFLKHRPFMEEDVERGSLLIRAKLEAIYSMSAAMM